jgi:hypothetical protein
MSIPLQYQGHHALPRAQKGPPSRNLSAAQREDFDRKLLQFFVRVFEHKPRLFHSMSYPSIPFVLL